MQSIHCKVSCNDQFRRFLFIGTEFSSLFSQVHQLLALDKEFVLKYKDNEGDLITLASNEELACALNYSEGNLLRLVAQPKDASVGGTTTSTTTESDVPVCPRETPSGRRGRGGRCRGGYGHGYGAHHGPMHGEFGSDMFKAKWQSKIDHIKSKLSELEKAPEKTPEQQQEILGLQKKLKKLECILEGGWEKKGKQGGKWEKKNQKMEKRMRKREQQKNKRPVHQLPEETGIQIATMKSQIDVLKPAMKEVKDQIKAKKEALKEAKATGSDPNQLLKEILVLKETRDGQKLQVKPLKQKIRELKYAC